MKKNILIFLTVLLITFNSFCVDFAKQVDFLSAGVKDINGNPVAGGSVYFYASGGTSLETVYSDRQILPENAVTPPITLDAYGRASVFADGVYRIVVLDSLGLTVCDYDNYEYESNQTDQNSDLDTRLTELESDLDDYVLKEGDTMTGTLIMGTNEVRSNFVPNANHTLVNKLYSDNYIDGKAISGEAGDGETLVFQQSENVYEPKNISASLGYDSENPFIKVVTGSETFSVYGGLPQASKYIYDETEFQAVFTYVTSNRATYNGKTYQINYFYNGYGRSSDVGNAYIESNGNIVVLGYGAYGNYTVYWTAIGVRID